MRFPMNLFMVGWLLTSWLPATDCPGLAITSQPQSQEACPGDFITFSVAATASAGTLSYQWRKDCAPLIAETGPTLELMDVSENDYGTYSCIITDDCGSITTNIVSLTRGAALNYQGITSSNQACVGGTAFFEVAAAGSSIEFQWRVDCVPIPGATMSTYSIDNVQSSDQGSYSVTVYNNCGSMNIDLGDLNVNGTLEITSQPEDVVACPGETVAFGITYNTDQANPQVLWYRDNVFVGIGAMLSIEDVGAEDVGTYEARISATNCSTVRSETATLSLTGPDIITQPESQNLCIGDDASFTVTATGLNPTYQWRKDCVLMPGETGSTLNLENITVDDLGTYTCTITDDCGSATTENASLWIGAICPGTQLDPPLVSFLINGTWNDGMGNDFPIDANGDGTVSLEEAAAITGSFDLSGLGLTDLSGLERFPNLTNLNVSGNNIHTWPDLSVFAGLTVLNLSGNPLGNLPADGNAALPVTLEELYMDDVDLTDLPDLSGLTQLNTFHANHNRLTNLSSLLSGTDLGNSAGDSIQLERNLLTNDNCTSLGQLETRVAASGASLDYDPQRDFTSLPNWPTLTVLDLGNNLDRNLSCPPVSIPASSAGASSSSGDR